MLNYLSDSISTVNMYLWLYVNTAFISNLIIILSIVLGILLLYILISKMYPYILRPFNFLRLLFKGVFSSLGEGELQTTPEIDKTIEVAGFSYDPEQDMFYSNIDSWQRKFGYCRLYDEATVPFGMIVDCEPVYFDYDGKKWLIEFWKGQYDMCTGCEIGIYYTDKSDFVIPNVFNGAFYKCVDDDDQLYMEFTLKKFDEVLFKRGEKHWWLTGFKLGEFSETYELSMDIAITFNKEEMLYEFIKGLKNANYSDEEFVVKGNSIYIKFEFAHTSQPLSRIKQAEWIIQRKNEALCEKYIELTAGCMSMSEKLKVLKEQSPDLYKKVLNPGKSTAIFDVYKKIKKYLSNG
ncbi:hypothetical protein Bccel_0628 [Pseudobacteroides cellulosolvens ATCC 35603 = DSM 2933]|uniref:DUF4474 domain-containing protein n=1 Tax=Pseudobacteroides cellulosolvens ATCC 35603 = DSM 2933 TaxID=398512 RepID=A0A0L6JI46_9FIRM|nr:hypothetical protein Bccel_0628 [Pseudobacteroides cellulosolvens ATCC 35603 = DSM 2933]